MLKTVGFPSTRTGDQTIVDGNLVIGTAGKGVDFSADPSAAGMTSELLDDYEEGTFTVAAARISSLVSNVAKYTKVGRLVTCEINVSWPSTDNTGNAVLFTGLPFTSAAGSLTSVGAVQINGTDVNTDVAQAVVLSTDANQTRFRLVPAIQASLVYVTAAQMNSDTVLISTFSYTTA